MSASDPHAIGWPDGHDQLNPPTPESVKETGLGGQFLLNLLLKVIYLYGVENIEEAVEELKLTRRVLFELLERSLLLTGGDLLNFPIEYGFEHRGRFELGPHAPGSPASSPDTVCVNVTKAVSFSAAPPEAITASARATPASRV